jgi:hypothetical protein
MARDADIDDTPTVRDVTGNSEEPRQYSRQLRTAVCADMRIARNITLALFSKTSLMRRKRHRSP